jgi:hypothetical protein
MLTCIRWIVVAAILVIASAALSAGREVGQSAWSDPLCWQSLAPDTGIQDVSLAMTRPALATVGTGEVWVSWDEDDARILKGPSGRWTSVPLPERDGFDGMWDPLVATSPTGQIFVVATANDGEWRATLQVARAAGESWEWLGAPIIASREPYTHARSPNIAFVNSDRPVLAWSEARDAQLVGLFVSRWDGTSWTRLGALDPDAEDTFLSPAVAVDSKQQIWIAWPDARGSVRVARWSGSSWIDIGRDALHKVVAAQGRTAPHELSLAIDGSGRAWVLRRVTTETTGLRLALARWDGVNWTDVPAPKGTEGKDATVWSAAMMLRADAPIIAWSQADASDNRYLFASEWTADDRWTARLSGVHMAAGVSNVRDVRLAPGDAHAFFVAWDEPGSDKRRTRVVRAYRCAAGETPAAPPASVVERDSWPTTVAEAAGQIVARLDDESKARVKATRKDQLIRFHSGWGMGIRNGLGLWRGNDKLLASCGNGTRVHPDDCSMVIIEAVWTLLQTP